MPSVNWHNYTNIGCNSMKRCVSSNFTPLVDHSLSLICKISLMFKGDLVVQKLSDDISAKLTMVLWSPSLVIIILLPAMKYPIC